MLKRGQSDLLTVVLLVGTVLVIGAAFTSLAVAQVVDVTSRGRIRQMLLTEQANLVIYREFEDESRLCLGILRIEPLNIRYALALLSASMDRVLLEEFPSALTINTLTPELKRVPRVYYAYGGEYYPVPVGKYITVVEVPMEVVENYVMRGKSFLVCIDKGAVEGGAKLVVLVYVGQELYEVAGWYVHA